MPAQTISGTFSATSLPLLTSAAAGRVVAAAAILLGSFSCFSAEEKKDEKKPPEPPHIAVVIPLGVAPGLTNRIKIRGQHLTNVTELRLTDTNCHAEVVFKSKAKAEVPKEMDAMKVGDTQLEVELVLPKGVSLGTTTFTVISPDGESKPHALLVVAAASLVNEKEPNGGFRDAGKIEFGTRVQGLVQDAKDVDVFTFHGKTKQKIVAEVFAARFGSSLDSLLTLYDHHGHIIQSNDDSDAGADSRLRAELPADGEYFLSLIDAHDRGSPAHVYQLELRVEE